MKAYVVIVISALTGNFNVSQEGYKSLESARNFIDSRASEMKEWLDDYVCITKPYTYKIKEIDIV